MSDSFYIILPSNSSMTRFPGNTVANYVTHLYSPITLSGQWELALLEIHFPNICFNNYLTEQAAKTNVTVLDEKASKVLLVDKNSTSINIKSLIGDGTDVTYSPSHIYVYCDLVEPQIVGDTLAPIIRMVNTDYSKHKIGASITKSFSSLQYVPLMKTNFSTVEMDLRDNTGKLIAFCPGHSAVTLHLRRCLPRGRSVDQ